jgi:hypothetical protein
MIQPYIKSKNKSVIVWVCFRDNSQKSDLTYMPGNADSTKAQVTLAVYLEVLEERLPKL